MLLHHIGPRVCNGFIKYLSGSDILVVYMTGGTLSEANGSMDRIRNS